MTSTIIARWVRNVLKKSGINVSVLVLIQRDQHLHWRTVKKGLKMTEISKAAGLSNAKTFGTFYWKTVGENFGPAILIL